MYFAILFLLGGCVTLTIRTASGAPEVPDVTVMAVSDAGMPTPVLVLENGKWIPKR